MQIIDGLGYAHEKGLVHLDIKPANIFLLPNDRLKILDFGLACPPGSEGLCGLGTPHYVSPEQIEGEAVDGRADLYSLGIMTFELLTGVRPFPEEDPSLLMEAHLPQELPGSPQLGAGSAFRALPSLSRSQLGKNRMTAFGAWKKHW